MITLPTQPVLSASLGGARAFRGFSWTVRLVSSAISARIRGCIVVMLAAGALAACGGPDTRTVHGTVLGGLPSAAGPILDQAKFIGVCNGAYSGVLVRLTGPDGKLAGTARLRLDVKGTNELPRNSVAKLLQIGIYDFMIKNVPVINGAYTLTISNVLGRFTIHDLNKTDLSC